MTNATPELWIELPYGDPDLGLVRRMQVHPLTAEQLTVWQANGERFAALADEWDDADRAMAGLPDDDPRVIALRKRRGEQATRGLGRALKVLKSVLAHERDRDWLEDQLMHGDMKLEGGATQVISLTIDAAKAWARDNSAAASTPRQRGKAKLAK